MDGTGISDPFLLGPSLFSGASRVSAVGFREKYRTGKLRMSSRDQTISGYLVFIVDELLPRFFSG